MTGQVSPATTVESCGCIERAEQQHVERVGEPRCCCWPAELAGELAGG